MLIVSAAIDGADAGRLVGRTLEHPPAPIAGARALHLLAVGKAAPVMALAFAARCGRPLRDGLVIGTHADSALPEPIECLVSSHPVPDARSVAAGRAALQHARAVGLEECLVVLLSGGASALMAVPPPGVSLAAKQAVTRRLLHTDADIHDINCVRKHLSEVKGGRMAAACAGQLATLAVSDVAGNDPSVIGSGPTVADPTTFADALRVLDARGGRDAFPREAVQRLVEGERGVHAETPKPGDASLTRSSFHLIGSSADALAGGGALAARLGYRVIILDSPVVGEARVQAVTYAHALKTLAREGREALCVLAGGETTVRVTGGGRGGRNQEFALAAAPVLSDLDRPAALASVGSDGVDGPTDAAGAVADVTTVARAGARGLDPMRYLDSNDAWSFFESLGDLVRTGRTNTNVGDLQVALVAPETGTRRSA